MNHQKIIAFDCDSTLSAIEGVDELARLSSPEILAEVVELTNQAMNGEVAVDEVFGRRLEMIRPGKDLCDDIGKLYIDRAERCALETVRALQDEGWHVLILSGGFAPCIEPFAAFLGISEVEAVPLYFDENGLYCGFDEEYPTTRNGGKPEILAALKAEFQPDRLVMVGDGVSDLETSSVVDQFIAYTGFVARSAVVEKAKFQIGSLGELRGILAI